MDVIAAKCARRAQQMREYRRNNPEARRKNNERAKQYRIEKPEQMQIWRLQNKDHIKAYKQEEIRKRQINRLTLEGRISDLRLYCSSQDKTYKRIADTPITAESITSLYKQQNGRCIYTSVELRPENGIYQMSVDRLDSTIGHSVENCALTTLPVNRFKSNMSVNELKQLLYKIKFNANRYHTFTEYTDLSTNANNKIGNLMGDLKRRAKKANLPHEITLDNFKIWRKQISDRCQISGVPVTWEPHRWNTGSIDRIDSSKGYTLDNIQLVIWPINMMKNDLTHAEAIEVFNYTMNGFENVYRQTITNPIEFTDKDWNELLQMMN
jgi:hypothetical protein